MEKHSLLPAVRANNSSSGSSGSRGGSSGGGGSGRPRLAIYQSASAMHGKRNNGFFWMSEVVRRQNEQWRSLLVDQLGESMRETVRERDSQ